MLSARPPRGGSWSWVAISLTTIPYPYRPAGLPGRHVRLGPVPNSSPRLPRHMLPMCMLHCPIGRFDSRTCWLTCRLVRWLGIRPNEVASWVLQSLPFVLRGLYFRDIGWSRESLTTTLSSCSPTSHTPLLVIRRPNMMQRVEGHSVRNLSNRSRYRLSK